jgi:inositol oxygenase
MIRYHSFYPWHREGAYRHFMNEDDEADLKAVLAFNREFRLRCLSS